MKVKLIAYTIPTGAGHEPMDVVETAAATCYNSSPDLSEFRLSRGCLLSGHLSVWEHLHLVFEVSGVSRALLAQLTRHRHASFSVQSQRYVDMSGAEYVTPKSISDDPDAQYLYESTVSEILRCYESLVKLGIPKEDARFILPNATCTDLIITCNARALIEMSHLRLCARAQWEIRKMFKLMKGAVQSCEGLKLLSEQLVPQCRAGKLPLCPERESCGLSPEAGSYRVETGWKWYLDDLVYRMDSPDTVICAAKDGDVPTPDISLDGMLMGKVYYGSMGDSHSMGCPDNLDSDSEEE